MNIAIRILASTLVALSVACGGGSSGGSGGAAPVGSVAGFAADGNYTAIDTFVTNIRTVNLQANTPPADDDCRGDITIVVDANATDVITGSGNCSLVNGQNSASYTLVGGFVNGDVDFEGRITIVFNGLLFPLTFSGTRNGDRLEATFSGRTPFTSQVAIDWDGSFSANR